ncbi:MAG TPA: hypothetical protein VGM80_13230 [Gaiellaceae bacterium]|jgi:hypothetical protein
MVGSGRFSAVSGAGLTQGAATLGIVREAAFETADATLARTRSGRLAGLVAR